MSTEPDEQEAAERKKIIEECREVRKKRAFKAVIACGVAVASTSAIMYLLYVIASYYGALALFFENAGTFVLFGFLYIFNCLIFFKLFTWHDDTLSKDDAKYFAIEKNGGS